MRSIWQLVILTVGLAHIAFAADYERLSALEREVVDIALKKHRLIIDQSPEGKKVGKYFIETESPFTERDPEFFRFFNIVHINTLDFIIEREILLEKGAPYESRIVTQNEQALINSSFRTLALIIPVRSSTTGPDEVDLLVVTRDAWTLRLAFNISGSFGAGGELSNLLFSLGDINIAGLNKSLTGSLVIRPYVFELALRYFDPRLLSTRHALTTQQGIILSRSDGHYEGIRGTFRAEMPLYAEDREWGYGFEFNHDYQPYYELTGGKVRTYQVPNSDQTADRAYRWLELNSSVWGTRSFGRKVKNNLTFGYGFNLYRPSLFENFPLTGEAAQQFIDDVFPVSEFESYIILSYQYFWNQFLSLYNFNTYALNEVVRLGPQLSITTHWAARPILFSDYNFFRPRVRASATFKVTNDSILSISASATSRFQGELVDNQILFWLIGVSPDIFGAGRLVTRGLIGVKWDDRNKSVFAVGGDLGLRGTPSQYQVGRHLFGTNIEYRSTSFPLWVFRIGGVAFYDTGTAYSNIENLDMTQTVGVGLRVLIVPINRDVLRIDYGIPVSGRRTGFANSLVTFGFGQAF